MLSSPATSLTQIVINVIRLYAAVAETTKKGFTQLSTHIACCCKAEVLQTYWFI